MPADRPAPRLAIVEPWFGESHATLFTGVAAHAGLECDLVTLPATRWRWRMRLGAWHLARLLEELPAVPDAILASDYVNLPLLRGLCPRIANVPAAIYFLENQATYPTRDAGPGDFEFVAANLLTCLAAERCVWCSRQQLDAFLGALPAFLARDQNLDGAAILESIEGKSVVIPIGVDLGRFDRAREERPDRTGQPLRLVWPHRFEHDKNPAEFFGVLAELAGEGLPFEVAAVG
ncbi:MAG TPA: DUF3524 domain-containing protein, partial [Polyangia bacterium]|nr:DUF3524 domain-containing protein [Polyangia bacterium]